MTFTEDGDKELWIFKRDNWSVPLFCTPVIGEDSLPYYLVMLALYVPADATMDAHAVLRGAAVSFERDRWFIPRGTVPTISEKAPGITPRYYLRYKDINTGTAKQAFEAEVKDAAPKHDEDFATRVFHASGFGDLGTFKLIWAELIGGIARSLIIENKPVDLGWFKLHALPFRANWKTNLLAKLPALHAALGASGDVRRAAALTLAGLDQEMMKTDLMSLANFRSKYRFRWVVEVEPTKAFEEYQADIEGQRISAVGPSAYIDRWGELSLALRETAIKLLRVFYEETSTDAGDIVKGSQSNQRRLVPLIRFKTGARVRVDRWDAPPVVDDGASEVRTPTGDVVTDRKARQVRNLPVIRREVPDVRKPRGVVSNGDGH